MNPLGLAFTDVELPPEGGSHKSEGGSHKFDLLPWLPALAGRSANKASPTAATSDAASAIHTGGSRRGTTRGRSFHVRSNSANTRASVAGDGHTGSLASSRSAAASSGSIGSRSTRSLIRPTSLPAVPSRRPRGRSATAPPAARGHD